MNELEVIGFISLAKIETCAEIGAALRDCLYKLHEMIDEAEVSGTVFEAFRDLEESVSTIKLAITKQDEHRGRVFKFENEQGAYL